MTCVIIPPNGKTSDYILSMCDIHNANTFHALCASIVHTLPNATCIDETNTSIRVSANTVQLFSECTKPMELYQCAHIVSSLCTQNDYLHTIGYGFFGYAMDSIYIINGCIAICVDNTYLAPCFTPNTLTIPCCPMVVPTFGNPEINALTNKANKLTNSMPIHAVYYSIGLLMMFCYTKSMDIDGILPLIKGTKIYYFLQRCFRKDASKRMALLI